MKLSQFKFKLPEEQIALYPTFHRDECRMMVVHRKSGRIDMFRTDENGEPLTNEDGSPQFIEFRHLIEYFDEGDVFVFNDTKVFPARLYGTKEKTDAKIEVFLLRELNESLRLWDVLVEPARKIRIQLRIRERAGSTGLGSSFSASSFAISVLLPFRHFMSGKRIISWKQQSISARRSCGWH